MHRGGFFCIHKFSQAIDYQRLTAPRRPKSLIFNNLQHKKLIHFFLAVFKKLAYYVYMKARKLKERKPILFTKARPFKMKNKVLDRKLKHKKNYVLDS
jgi:hypothetical protein